MDVRDKMFKKLEGLPTIFKQYAEFLISGDKTHLTINSYMLKLSAFFNSLPNWKKHPTFYKITEEKDITTYFQTLEEKNTKLSHLQATWSVLNQFYSWLVDKNYISTNPVALTKRPRGKEKAEVNILKQKNVWSLLDSVNNTDETITFKIRNYAIISLMICGLKPNEIQALNIEDYNWREDLIFIRSSTKSREIILSDDASMALCEWLDARKELEKLNTSALFVSLRRTRMSTDAMADIVEKHGQNIGIEKLTPQDLRASGICLLISKKIPLNIISDYFGINIEQCLNYVSCAFDAYLTDDIIVEPEVELDILLKRRREYK